MRVEHFEEYVNLMSQNENFQFSEMYKVMLIFFVIIRSDRALKI